MIENYDGRLVGSADLPLRHRVPGYDIVRFAAHLHVHGVCVKNREGAACEAAA